MPPPLPNADHAHDEIAVLEKSSTAVEALMRKALDGTFRTISHIDGKHETRRVAIDFVPSYEPKPQPTGVRTPLKREPRVWTPEQDAELLTLRRQGWSKNRLARHFHVRTDTIRHRIDRLRQRELEAAQ